MNNMKRFVSIAFALAGLLFMGYTAIGNLGAGYHLFRQTIIGGDTVVAIDSNNYVRWLNDAESTHHLFSIFAVYILLGFALYMVSAIAFKRKDRD